MGEGRENRNMNRGGREEEGKAAEVGRKEEGGIRGHGKKNGRTLLHDFAEAGHGITVLGVPQILAVDVIGTSVVGTLVGN
jgi:hypothetical protein